MRVVGISAVLMCIWVGTGCVASSDDVSTGTLSINLVGQSSSSAIYRLRDAIITVDGPATAVFNTEDDPNRTSLSANVVTGDYVATLGPGFRMERVDGTTTTPVTATLISPNPVAFTVLSHQRTTVPLRFHVAQEDVDMSQGYDIVLEIEEETSSSSNLVAINDLNGHLVRIDPTTLTATDIGPLGVVYMFGDCAFNPTDSTLYMVDGRGNNGLYRVNTTTGAASLVGLHGIPNMAALAFHPPTNRLYGISADTRILYLISTTTGAATPVGPPMPVPFRGMAWDSKRNTMVGSDGAALLSINVSTGIVMPVAPAGIAPDLGMTYDSVLDRFWVVDIGGQIVQLDPNQGFARTFMGVIAGARTCVASLPQTP